MPPGRHHARVAQQVNIRTRSSRRIASLCANALPTSTSPRHRQWMAAPIVCAARRGNALDTATRTLPWVTPPRAPLFRVGRLARRTRTVTGNHSSTRTLQARERARRANTVRGCSRTIVCARNFLTVALINLRTPRTTSSRQHTRSTLTGVTTGLGTHPGASSG